MSYDPESPENLGIAVRPTYTSPGGLTTSIFDAPDTSGPQQGYTWTAFDNGTGYWWEREIGPNGVPTGRTRQTTSRISTGGGSGSVPTVSLNLTTPGTTTSTRQVWVKKPDGDELWQYDELNPSNNFMLFKNTPAETGPKTFSYGGQVVGIDPATGQPAWTYQFPQDTPAASDGMDNIRTFNGQLVSVDPVTGTFKPLTLASGSLAPGSAPSASTLSSGSIGNTSSAAIASVLKYIAGGDSSSGGGGGGGSSAAQNYGMQLGYNQKKNELDIQYEQKKSEIDLAYEIELQKIRDNAPMSLADQQRLEWQAGQNALDRAQDLAIEAARLGIQQGQLDLQRVSAFKDAVTSTDPGAVGAFLKAYGTIGAGIAAGATALSDAALLPAAEILQQLRTGTGTGIPASSLPPGVNLGGGVPAPSTPSALPPSATSGTGTTPATTPPPVGDGAPPANTPLGTPPTAATQYVTLPDGTKIPLTASGGMDWAAYMGVNPASIKTVDPKQAMLKQANERETAIQRQFEEETGLTNPGLTPATKAAYDEYMARWLEWRAQMDQKVYNMAYDAAREGVTGLLPNEIDPASLNLPANSGQRYFENPEGVGIIGYDVNSGQTYQYAPGGALPGNEAKDFRQIGSSGQVVSTIANPLTPPPSLPPDQGQGYNQIEGNTITSGPTRAAPTGNQVVAPYLSSSGTVIQSRAGGGIADTSKPILVGERGPELIMPAGRGLLNVIPLAGAMADGGTISADGVPYGLDFNAWAAARGLIRNANGTYSMPDAPDRPISNSIIRTWYNTYVANTPAGAAPMTGAPAPAPTPPPPTNPMSPGSDTQPAPPAPNNLPPVTQPAPPSQTSTGQVTVPPALYPTVGEIRDLREQTPFEYISPYKVNYETQAPTVVSTSQLGLQSARGIPVQDQMWEWQRFRLPGVNAGSINQGL